MYERKSRLRGKQRAKLIEMFVAGVTVRATAEITGVNRNTVRVFFQRLRKLIASKLPSYELAGEVEADESYFGGVRKGRVGRGAAGKIAVFGL
jgi:transposase